ncbi:MAG: hypothetical protein ACE5K0_09150 [Candidatus Methanofastidiosia archaeon]
MSKKICKEKDSSKERICDIVAYPPNKKGYPTVLDMNKLSEICLRGRLPNSKDITSRLIKF